MDKHVLTKRNIGISAHIDAGKTTLSERILFFTRKIHVMHEVKGRDGVGATMDSMDLERERGITIQSAATNVTWRDHSIDIIDTPGHVDFTIEVERALRVLDGAVLVLCAVGGVQSQTITVDRQLKRYRVPRVAFINKCDRAGADPLRAVQDLRRVLGHDAVLLQLPIGIEDRFAGVVDLVTMRALYFEGTDGDTVREAPIPEELREQAAACRHEMIDRASLHCDDLAEAYLGDSATEEHIRRAIRKGTISTGLTPVLLGAAGRNKGVQPLLDAIVDYLPDPSQVHNVAQAVSDGHEVELVADPDLPAVALAFKLEEGRYGQLSYLRVYQGTIRKGDELTNVRTGATCRVGRLIRMHADSMEDITSGSCGDIVALFGIDCISGDTFVAGDQGLTMSGMHVPRPVISLAVKALDKKSADNMTKALHRFAKEDPTFKTYVDPESGQTIVSGMGELHLEVYLERTRREYGVRLEVGRPQVAYRETVSQAAAFDYTHRKQTGGAGQYARVCGTLEPWAQAEYEFVDAVRGGAIPREYVPSCDKGFRACLERGSLIGFPVVNVRVTVDDGNWHPVDSSDLAFQTAAIAAFRQAYDRARPIVLEPMMRVSVEGPVEFQGNVLGSLNQRRGLIVSTNESGTSMRVDAEVPLAEMFGYSTTLRTLTQGRAEFTMEFLRYSRVPEQLAEELKEQFAERRRP